MFILSPNDSSIFIIFSARGSSIYFWIARFKGLAPNFESKPLVATKSFAPFEILIS